MNIIIEKAKAGDERLEKYLFCLSTEKKREKFVEFVFSNKTPFRIGANAQAHPFISTFLEYQELIARYLDDSLQSVALEMVEGCHHFKAIEERATEHNKRTDVAAAGAAGAAGERPTGSAKHSRRPQRW